MRRAIEGLAAERQNAPDYTPTLKSLSSHVADIEESLDTIVDSPAMRLTPENLAASIAKASETARAGDRDTIQKAGEKLRTSIASINGVVQQAWTADRQLKQLIWIAAIAFVFGILSFFALSRLIGDAPKRGAVSNQANSTGWHNR